MGVYTRIGVGDRSRLAACKACHCLAARRQARALTRLFDASLRPHGLRVTQFSVLAALALKGPTPLKALADVLGLERTTLTRVAALLERNGWVRAATSNDARERPVGLTRAGRRTLDAAFPAWKQAQAVAERHLAESIRGPDSPRPKERG